MTKHQHTPGRVLLVAPSDEEDPPAELLKLKIISSFYFSSQPSAGPRLPPRQAPWVDSPFSPLVHPALWASSPQISRATFDALPPISLNDQNLFPSHTPSEVAAFFTR